MRDHSAGGYAVYCPCIVCHKQLRMSDAVMDLDGPAFQAYYHEECLPPGHPPIPQCSNRGCTRPECQCKPGEER